MRIGMHIVHIEDKSPGTTTDDVDKSPGTTTDDVDKSPGTITDDVGSTFISLISLCPSTHLY